MSTPRSVKLDQHIFAFIHDNFIKVFASEVLDGMLVPILRQVFGQVMLRNFSVQVVLNKFPQVVFVSNIMLVMLSFYSLVLVNIVLHLDNSHGGELFTFETQKLNDSSMIIFFSIHCDKHYFIAEFFGQFCSYFDGCFVFVRFVIDK